MKRIGLQGWILVALAAALNACAGERTTVPTDRDPIVPNFSVGQVTHIIISAVSPTPGTTLAVNSCGTYKAQALDNLEAEDTSQQIDWTVNVLPLSFNVPSPPQTTKTSTSGQSITVCGYSSGYGALTATLHSAGSISKTFAIDVGNPAVSVAILGGDSKIQEGNDVQLTARGTDQHGNQANRAATWQTSNAAVATVNSSGIMHGVANGDVTITATLNGVSGTRIYHIVGFGDFEIYSGAFGPVGTVGWGLGWSVRMRDAQGSSFNTPVTVTYQNSNNSVGTLSTASATSAYLAWDGGWSGYVALGGLNFLSPGTTTVTVTGHGTTHTVVYNVYAALTLSVTGKSIVKASQTCTWFGNVSNGVGPYSYNWTSVGIANIATEPSEFTGVTDTHDFSITLLVLDSRGVRSPIVTKNVTYSPTAQQCTTY